MNGPPSSEAGPSSRPTATRQILPSRPGAPPQLPQQSLNQLYYLPASRHPVDPLPATRTSNYQPQSQWTSAWPTNYSSSSSQPTPSSTYRNTPGAAPSQQTPYVAQNLPQRTRFTEPHPQSKIVPKFQTSPTVPLQVPQTPAPTFPSPARTPTPPKYRHWDRVLKDFLVKMGLKQSLNGFECDMLVMNADFERSNAPGALHDLLQGVLLVQQGADVSSPERNRSLDERKLDYVHNANPASQTSITKSISAFLAQNRAKNDASNRAEFIYTLAEKRKRINDEACRANPDGVTTSDGNDDDKDVSCARTDAKPVDRDVQMKYDIAKNTDGPLRRTTRKKGKASGSAPAATTAARPRTKSVVREQKKATSPVVVKSESEVKEKALHLGLDQRLANIETHFSVRYVPAHPDNFLSRLQFLEDHIIRLEKDYPPWAALHFNQPNRGWPPPPRATPIIVPPHLRSSVSSTATAPPPKVGGVKMKNTGSSLQRAVMDQLAMKEARNDLAGRRL